MRFISAVALAAVMLWVPVDASGQDASGQEVTIEAVRMLHTDILRSTLIDFESRNNTSRTIVAWRGNLEILNPFGESLIEVELLLGENGDLSPRGTHVERFHMGDYSRDRLEGYEVTDLRLRLTDLEVAYAP